MSALTLNRPRYAREQGPKLHQSQVEIIIDQLRMNRYTYPQLAEQWSVTPGHICHIARRRCWRHVHG